jgi:hypothetical protein
VRADSFDVDELTDAAAEAAWTSGQTTH